MLHPALVATAHGRPHRHSTHPYIQTHALRRRYADVVVHRQLLAAVTAGSTSAVPGAGLTPSLAVVPLALEPPLHSQLPPLPGQEVAGKAAVMNERHRTAKRAQKECSDLYLLLLLHAQVRHDATAPAVPVG